MVRHARSATVVLTIIVGAIAAHLFSPAQPSALLNDLIHSLHGPGFAVIAAILFYIIGPRQSVLLRYIIAGAVAALIALLSEIAQIPGPRNAEFSDLVVDGIGIVGALGMLASFDPRIRSHFNQNLRAFVSVTAGIALVLTFAPSIWYAYAMTAQSRAMPTLLSFENRWESSTYRQPEGAHPELLPAPFGWPVTNSTIARANESGKYGIFLRLHPAQDWRNFAALSFVAAASGDNFVLAVGIRDQRPGRGTPVNRHYERFELTREPRRYVVPLAAISASAKERPFDFEHLEAVVFSAAKPGSGKQLLLDDIRLEPL